MSVALLLVCEGLEVLRDLEPDDGGRGVGQILREFLGVHVEKTAGLLRQQESR